MMNDRIWFLVFQPTFEFKILMFCAISPPPPPFFFFFFGVFTFLLIPMDGVRCESGRSLAGIAGSNPAGGMDICLL